MKNILIVAVLFLFVGGGFLPTITSIVPQESCCPNGWVYDEDNATLSIEFSGLINASFVETYVTFGKSEVGVIFSHEYIFSNGSQGYIEASYDQGTTWKVIKTFYGNTSDVRDVFVTLTTDSLWVRFTVESRGGNGCWCVWDIDLIGDTRGEPPVSRIIYTGIQPDFWFTSPVRIEIMRMINYLELGKSIIYSMGRKT